MLIALSVLVSISPDAVHRAQGDGLGPGVSEREWRGHCAELFDRSFGMPDSGDLAPRDAAAQCQERLGFPLYL